MTAPPKVPCGDPRHVTGWQGLLINLTSCTSLVVRFTHRFNLLKYDRKIIYREPVHFWSTHIKLAVIMRISSDSLPQRTTHFLTVPSSSPVLVLHHGKGCSPFPCGKLVTSSVDVEESARRALCTYYIRFFRYKNNRPRDMFFYTLRYRP